MVTEIRKDCDFTPEQNKELSKWFGEMIELFQNNGVRITMTTPEDIERIKSAQDAAQLDSQTLKNLVTNDGC